MCQLRYQTSQQETFVSETHIALNTAVEMATKVEVETLVDILMETKSEDPAMHHTRTSGTPFFWREAIGEKNYGPLTDEDIDIIAEAKKKDPPSAHEVFANLFLGNKAAVVWKRMFCHMGLGGIHKRCNI